MISAAVIEALKEIVPSERILFQEPMKLHTTFRIGGPADCLIYLENEDQLCRIQKYLRLVDVPYTVIGNGSNLLVSDDGYRGIVLVIGKYMSEITVKDCYLEAEAGALMSQVAKTAKEHGLTGLEFAAGIPGTVGGGAVMNAGAYGGELKDVVTEVTALYPDGVKVLTPAQLDFSYRHSVFSAGEGIVLGAKLKLETGDKDAIKAEMDELMARRKASQPLELPSAGSTFKRPAGYFAGTLIEGCGLKGCRVGGAEVSPKHAGFVVNVGGATCADVLALIEKVQKTVYDAHGVMLEPEVKIIR